MEHTPRPENNDNNLHRLDDSRLKKRQETLGEQTVFLRNEIIRVISDEFPADEQLPDRRQMIEEVADISEANLQNSVIDALTRVLQIAFDASGTDQEKRFVDKLQKIIQDLEQAKNMSPREFLARAQRHFRNHGRMLKNVI